MSYIQFEILRRIEETSSLDINKIIEDLFISLDCFNENYNYLKEKDYVSENNNITEKGIQFLESYKIDNAIILAAGMSTRFVPLSFENPKGLLDVKGQSLIERQILQLREKGIEEIVIVVGYMKEKFEFLSKKYNVILVESTEYKVRNNHSSVYAARDYLKNSIITSSDLYFAENIFQKYAYDSYYCTIYEDGLTPERGVLTDEDNKILDTFYGERAHDVWVTLGYAYFSKRFSNKMIEILDREYNEESTKNKFWADIQDDHLDELYMYAKKCRDNIIYEFDSLEELRVFDEKYKSNSGSEIMKTICDLLNIKEENIINIETLKNIKESLFKFECDNELYLCDIGNDIQQEICYNNRFFKIYRSNNDKGVNIYK